MIPKNRSQRTALLKYSFAVSLFILMVILSSATVTNFRQVPPPPQPPKPVNKNVSQSCIYDGDVSERLASFPGGQEALNKFLAKNIKYPAADKKSRLQGKVVLQFFIEIDGSLTDIKAVRSPSPAMGAEAVRILRKSPNWKPYLLNDKPTRAQYSQMVSFTL